MPEPESLLGVIARDARVLDAILGRAGAARQRAVTRELVDGSSVAIAADSGPASPRGTRAWVAGQLFRASPGEAYERWGTQCFARLDGNFCLAIHDPVLRRWRIAADLAGAKPLFYAVARPEDGEAIVFGASALEVLRAAGLPAVADARLLKRYLAQGALAGDAATLLQGVRALRRRHYLEIVPGAAGTVLQTPFPDEAASPEGATLEERARQLRDLLCGAVQAQDGGNAAVACSGGIDSTGILGALREMRGPKAPLHVFAYLQKPPGIPEAWDERPWAELAAAHAHATLHAVELEASELPGLLAAVVLAQDFPFGSPVVLAQSRLFQVAADRGHDAMLSGRGADLLFGGGDTHLATQLATLVRRGRLFGAARMGPGAAAHAAAGWTRFLASATARVLFPGGIEPWRPASIAWGSRAWFGDRVAGEPRAEAASQRGLEPLHALIDRQLGDSLGTTTLLYEERNAIAQRLENRLPYLIASMVHLSRACRPDFLASEHGQPKHILRVALRGLVPEAILQRRQRIGFAVPVLPWLLQQQAWADQRYGELRALPFFDGPTSREIWARLSTDTPEAWRCAFRLWRWIVLLEWSKAHNVRFE